MVKRASNYRRLGALFIASLLFTWVTPAVRANQDSKDNILILHSYHAGLSWTDGVDRGIREVFAPFENITLYIENMDTKRYAVSALEESIIRHLRDKYGRVQPKVIIVSDNNALAFMKEHHHSLFPGVPIVFCGINYFHDGLLDDSGLFTGVVEKTDARTTFELINHLHPGLKRCVVIGDETPTGQAELQAARSVLGESQNGVAVEYWDSLPLKKILNRVATLNRKTDAVLLTLHNRDPSGTYYSYEESGRTIAETSPVPVYGLWDFYINTGIVGGYMASAPDQGALAARMASQIIQGKPVGDLPIVKRSPNRYIIDMKAAEPFGVSRSQLPEDTIFHNAQRSLLYTYRWEITGAICLMLGEALVIFVLVWRWNAVQRRSHERLRQSEKLFRELFTNIPDASVIIDAETHRFLEANVEAVNRWGYTREELLHMTPGEILANEHATDAGDQVEKVVREGRCLFDCTHIGHDGRLIPTEVAARMIEYDGKPSVLALSRDQTARRRIEDALRAERGLFVGGPTIVFKWRAEPNLPVLYVSPNVKEQLGYSPQDLISGRIAYPSLVHPDDLVRIVRELEDGSANGLSQFELEYRLRNYYGDYRWMREFVVVHRDENGRSTTYSGYLIDVTENKLNEIELREASKRAEAAARSKSEFLANMSHEIRTPMSALLGYISLLEDGCIHQCDFKDCGFEECVETIKRNGEHLLQIINQILDISKIEAGQMEMEHTDCSPVHLLADLESMMKIRAEAKGIRFIVECVGMVPAEISTDPLRLKQILVNLVENAIKFTELGEVRVDARFVEDSSKKPFMKFEVSDTGVGITDEEIARLFQPFSQADTSTTRRFGGTGLGLSISRRLAVMLGGDITIKSQPGKGSKFTVSISAGDTAQIRLVDPQEEPLPHAGPSECDDRESPEPLAGFRILLVEDGPDNQRLISLFLRKAGAEIDLAQNGQIGFDATMNAREAGTPFDLIVMDMQMPVLDGYEATRRLRSAGVTTPIIALTAHALDHDREICLAAGCTDYLSKPVKREELVKAIRLRVGEQPANSNTHP